MSDNELLLAISNIVEKQVESVKQELTQKIDKIQEEVTKNRLILENDISRKAPEIESTTPEIMPRSFAISCSGVDGGETEPSAEASVFW